VHQIAANTIPHVMYKHQIVNLIVVTLWGSVVLQQNALMSELTPIVLCLFVMVYALEAIASICVLRRNKINGKRKMIVY
jgi:hypothetical protein